MSGSRERPPRLDPCALLAADRGPCRVRVDGPPLLWRGALSQLHRPGGGGVPGRARLVLQPGRYRAAEGVVRRGARSRAGRVRAAMRRILSGLVLGVAVAGASPAAADAAPPDIRISGRSLQIDG